MMSFASLFLSQKQINPGFLDYITNGSPATMLWNNPNIILNATKPVLSSLITPTTYNKYSKWLSHYSSLRGHDSLEEILITEDPEEQLPRILFCKLAWINFNCHVLANEGEGDIVDHSFVIIKHSNTHFQLVQGYVSDSSTLNSECMMPPFMGYNADSWKRSGNTFSSIDGFHLPKMIQFLVHLRKFTVSDNFDSAGYYKMFGAQHTDGKSFSIEGSPPPSVMEAESAVTDDILGKVESNYWPSLYHIELKDSSIIGCGSREMAEAVDAMLPKLST
jgi:hypothetical protein